MLSPATQAQLARGWRVVIAEPAITAWQMLPQFLVTLGSVYLVAMFGMAHQILPPLVAIPMAVGFEWSWLRSVATAGKVRRTPETERYIRLLTWTALITVISYGVLYILGLPSVGVIPATLGPWWGVPLALAKVVPIALMGFASANLHRLHRQDLTTAEQLRTDYETERARQLQAERDAVQIEIEREWRRAHLAEQIKTLRVANSRERSANTARALPPAASGTGTNSAANTDREQLRAHIARTLREQPGANRTALAKELGISRTLLYELIGEAKQVGEL